jgi:hypothetical protein
MLARRSDALRLRGDDPSVRRAPDPEVTLSTSDRVRAVRGRNFFSRSSPLLALESPVSIERPPVDQEL